MALWHDGDIPLMTSETIEKIVICGSGLASWLTAAALSNSLPSAIEITVLETPNSDNSDIFYGSVTSPSTYNFYLDLGLTEADLLMHSQSTFSYGTQYRNWGLTEASWIQCFHSPFPSWDGVSFAHHLVSGAENLEHYLMSAQAATHGKFAHPPADKGVALSSAEYGYHFRANDITNLMKTIAKKNNVKIISQNIASVEKYNGKITMLKLDNGQMIPSDLYVDATGPDGQLISSLGNDVLQTHRFLGAFYSEIKNTQIGPPLRQLDSDSFGWQSVTPLQDSDAVLTVFDTQSEDEARKSHPADVTKQCEVPIGQRKRAWIGNCVTVGQTAAVIEPTSPAPIMLLQMDIQRLLELIPVTKNMSIESKIFNESFQSDVDNIRLFNAAFYQINNLAQTPYWTTAKTKSISAKLDRKLEQFSNRGLLVNYDLEPFNTEDWTILHYGIGRQPKKNDIFATLSDKSKIGHELRHMSNSIQNMVAKMPPHHIYLGNYLNYLERNHVSRL